MMTLLEQSALTTQLYPKLRNMVSISKQPYDLAIYVTTRANI